MVQLESTVRTEAQMRRRDYGEGRRHTAGRVAHQRSNIEMMGGFHYLFLMANCNLINALRKTVLTDPRGMPSSLASSLCDFASR